MEPLKYKNSTQMETKKRKEKSIHQQKKKKKAKELERGNASFLLKLLLF